MSVIETSETQSLGWTFRDILQNRNRGYAEDDSFFFRCIPLEKRNALYNNYEASLFGRGYVPDLARQLLNSKVLPTMHKILVSKISSGASIEGESDADVSKFKDSIIDFNKRLDEIASYALLNGEAASTINIIDNKSIIKVYPPARYSLTYNAINEIIEGVFYQQLFDGETSYCKYCLTEHRFKKSNKYYVEYNLIKYDYSSRNDDIKKYKLEADEIPIKIKQLIEDVEINKLKEIAKIGIYNFQNSHTNLMCPNSNVGESQYIDALDLVVSYDYSFTYREIDKNIGRGRVLVPTVAAMGGGLGPSINIGNSSISVKATRNKTILDNTFMLPYANPSGPSDEPLKINQFELRTTDWIEDRKDLIRELCIRVGLSVMDYDPALASGYRTTVEINSLNDITAQTINAKRELYGPELNRMLNDLAELLHSQINVFIKWDKSTTMNQQVNMDIVEKKLNLGLISKLTAMKELNPNWNQAEIDAELNRINTETDNIDADAQFKAV